MKPSPSPAWARKLRPGDHAAIPATAASTVRQPAGDVNDKLDPESGNFLIIVDPRWRGNDYMKDDEFVKVMMETTK